MIKKYYFCPILITKMKKIILSAIALISGFITFGQSTLEQTTKINIGMQGLDFNYELPISKQLLWDSSVGLGLGMNASSTATNYNFYLLDPVVSMSTGLKWMYNYNKRSENEKNISNNAANYIGIQTKYSFGHPKALDLNKALLTDVHWGVQRNISKKFVFNTNIGIGYMHDFDTNYGGIAPILRVKIGYRLF